ncbi:MAG: ribonuclease J [Pseudomonadota bacterium]
MTENGALMDQELLFVPLGGAGEIGLNLNLYGMDDQWLMVDLGISFADEYLPGADIILPEPRFIEERRQDLKGLVLTHAHEDHFGAVPHLWDRLRCPIYCTAFTANVLKRKLDESPLRTENVPIHVVAPGERFQVGPFDCGLVHMTHSIPEANALTIRTPLGNLLHTGDWKLDPAPLLGEVTDGDSLASFGEEGVLAMVADSTNVLTPGTSGSEADVRDSLTDLVAKLPNRVVITTFASNVARLETAIKVAAASGRQVCAVGRSIKRMLQVAAEVGYLKDLPPLVDEKTAAQLPRDKVLWVATGCQGEQRAAMARIGFGQHPSVKLEPGDTVIFSSKIIPGNERTLYNLHNTLVGHGIEVITEQDHFVHVTGHPCRDEVEQMYRWIKPKIAVPVHGEARHLHEHAALARSLGVETALDVRNGDMIRLAPGEAQVIDEVPVGRLVMENDELIDAGDDLYRTRRRLMAHGTILVSIVLDQVGSLLASPNLSSFGAVDLGADGELSEGVLAEVENAIEDLPDDDALDDARIRDTVRAAVRRACSLMRQKRPIIEVQITRLEPSVLEAMIDREPSTAS